MSASAPTGKVERATSYASEPIRLSQVQLDRRAQQLADLVSLCQRCGQEAASSSIDESLAEIREEVRSKALDEDFSVAVRERWQTWSRQSKPIRRELASAAAVDIDPQTAEADPSDSEHMSESSEDASVDEDEVEERPAKRARSTASHVHEDDWDHIREAREALLSEMDTLLPSAFRFSDRQVRVYAQRLKPRYFSSLEEPFHPDQIRGALRGLADKSHSDSTSGLGKTSLPVVLSVSFFASSLDDGLDGRDRSDEASSASNPFGQPRDDYVNKLSGEGPNGLKKTQTVEILSTQTLDALRHCLFCCSDEEPERDGWSQRLQQQVRPKDSTTTEHEEFPNSPPYAHEKPVEIDEEGREPRFATYTGKRRETDTIMLIEDKLYGRGYAHGSTEHEQDYVTLLNKLNAQRNDQAPRPGFKSGGNLTKSFNELDNARVGKTYWMLHQGGCVHAFIIEQIRALRPEELSSLSSQTNGAVAEASRFPRVTWLTTTAILRFASDSTDNYSIGHRILNAEGHVAYAYQGTGLPTARGANVIQRLAANGSTARSKRRDDSLLKWKKGKCFACSSRKAQVGILGGDRVVLSQSLPSADSSMPGVDEHFVSLCLSCAALLGLPTTKADDDSPYDIDWAAVNTLESRRSGWTAFPMN